MRRRGRGEAVEEGEHRGDEERPHRRGGEEAEAAGHADPDHDEEDGDVARVLDPGAEADEGAEAHEPEGAGQTVADHHHQQGARDRDDRLGLSGVHLQARGAAADQAAPGPVGHEGAQAKAQKSRTRMSAAGAARPR